MRLEKDCQVFLKKLGAKIKQIRKVKGWTLEETEDHGWPSWRHLQKIESGKNITMATLWKLSKVYRIPMERFFEGV